MPCWKLLPPILYFWCIRLWEATERQDKSLLQKLVFLLIDNFISFQMVPKVLSHQHCLAELLPLFWYWSFRKICKNQKKVALCCEFEEERLLEIGGGPDH